MPRSPFRSFREVERNLTSEHNANIHLLLSDVEVRKATNVSMHRKFFIDAFGNHRCLTSYVEINREKAEMAKTMAFFLTAGKSGSFFILHLRLRVLRNLCFSFRTTKCTSTVFDADRKKKRKDRK